MSAAPFTLVDEHQKHLRFNGRAPRTLVELLTARADFEHRRRLAEIKAMAGKLEQLDALLPALASRGVTLNRGEISSYDRGVISVHPSWIGTKSADKMVSAMLAIGFREISRGPAYPGDRDDQVTLKFGRSLVIRTAVTRAEPAPAAPASAGAPQAEGARA